MAQDHADLFLPAEWHEHPATYPRRAGGGGQIVEFARQRDTDGDLEDGRAAHELEFDIITGISVSTDGLPRR